MSQDGLEDIVRLIYFHGINAYKFDLYRIELSSFLYSPNGVFDAQSFSCIKVKLPIPGTPAMYKTSGEYDRLIASTIKPSISAIYFSLHGT